VGHRLANTGSVNICKKAITLRLYCNNPRSAAAPIHADYFSLTFPNQQPMVADYADQTVRRNQALALQPPSRPAAALPPTCSHAASAGLLRRELSLLWPQCSVRWPQFGALPNQAYLPAVQTCRSPGNRWIAGWSTTAAEGVPERTCTSQCH
jgi:hypothetical protein